MASDRPQVAAKIANFLAQRHIQNSEDSRLRHMQSAVRWLEVQGREARISLQKAENNIVVFSETMDLIGEPNLLALNRELKKLCADIADLQARGLDPSNRLESMLRFEARKMRTLAYHNRDFLHLQTLKREVADLRLLRKNINM